MKIFYVRDEDGWQIVHVTIVVFLLISVLESEIILIQQFVYLLVRTEAFALIQTLASAQESIQGQLVKHVSNINGYSSDSHYDRLDLSILLFLCIYAAICVPDCDHGTCTSPQTCTCDAGYTGNRCRLGERNIIILMWLL